MNRTGLIIALAIGGVAAIVFTLAPQLDLAATRALMSPDAFAFRASPLQNALRGIAIALIWITVAAPVLALLLKLALPHRPMLLRGRTVVLLIVTFVLGPVLATNTGLKDNWGRPRPRDVVAFGGTQAFLPWWDPRGPCPANCSFVAGEPSGAFWTLAAASVAPPPVRPLAYAAALTFGTLTGLLRIVFGGHFLSDVVFAGVLTYLIVWLVHGALYRRRRPWLTDEAIESTIGRLGLALRRPFTRAPD